jgi:8-oxo-dGTP pyrophosphatase MutT (NUDIX family)
VPFKHVSTPGKKAKRLSKSLSAAAVESERLQYGALPWRQTEDGLEVMLVSSRDTRRWIIPKGWPMAGRSGMAAAAIEAMEEAGLLGVMSEEPIGHFHYAKRLSRRVDLCKVEVFSLRVVRQRHHWPEKHERVTQWYPVAKAVERVSDPELGDLIAAFARNLAFNMVQA